MWSDGDALFSDLIQKTTSKHSIILHAPIHNSLVVLSGRQSFISYPGHLWTHGIQYGTRLAIVEKIYRGSPEAIELLQQSGITHILVGPNEIGLKDFIIHQSFFDDHFKVIADQKPFKLYSFIDSDYSNSPKLCPIPKRV